jgi:hypothetical protein
LPLVLGLIGLSKKGSPVEKKNRLPDFKFRPRWLKLFQMGPIIKFQLPKTIASPPPEIHKKEKKCWYNDGTFCQRQTSGSTETFVALAEIRLRDNYSHRSDHDPFF